MIKPTYAFGYYGGKLSHLARLLPLLPKCHTYVEPFGGSAAVLLNRDPSPVEVYNDLDGGVVNFFRVLRERPDELARVIELSPYSRADFEQACSGLEGDDLERARRFCVRVGQSRFDLPSPLPRQWSYCIKDAKRDMSSAVSAWVGIPPRLRQVAERLKRAQIENEPAIQTIQRYDSAGTLFYIDPPYVTTTREGGSQDQYVHEMTDGDHIELAAELRGCSGRVALSGYESALYDQLYAGWYKTTWAARATANHRSSIGSRTEVLWTNYDPVEATEQPLLFDAEQGT